MEITKIHKIILNKEDINNAIYNYLLEKKVIDNNISLEEIEDSIYFQISQSGDYDEGTFKQFIKSIEINLK